MGSITSGIWRFNPATCCSTCPTVHLRLVSAPPMPLTCSFHHSHSWSEHPCGCSYHSCSSPCSMASLPFSSPLGLSPLGTIAPVILLRFPCVAVFPLLETKPREINCGGVHDVPPPRWDRPPAVWCNQGAGGQDSRHHIPLPQHRASQPPDCVDPTQASFWVLWQGLV